MHKSIDPRGKQSPREGMAGGARRQMGRGREDDAAGGNIELIFILIELLEIMWGKGWCLSRTNGLK